MSGEELSSKQARTVTEWDELTKMPEYGSNQRQSYAEKVVEETRGRFDAILAQRKETVESTKRRIAKLDEQIAVESQERRIELFEQQKRDRQRSLRVQEAFVEFARMPTVEDVEYRTQVRKQFAKEVKEAVPDELPLVFHGSNNIGIVRQIIQTHGLKTPEQRGESMTSFATQIDVTAKTNIQTTCEFAEPGLYWMPYGAIFAFMPKSEEEVAVREAEANGSTEVYGGVKGVDFKEESERLFGIITTPENIQRMREWCKETGLDESKVVTHGEFLEGICDYKMNDGK